MELLERRQSRTVFSLFKCMFICGLHFIFTVSAYWFVGVFVMKSLMQGSLKWPLSNSWDNIQFSYKEFLSQGPCKQKRRHGKIYSPSVWAEQSKFFVYVRFPRHHVRRQRLYLNHPCSVRKSGGSVGKYPLPGAYSFWLSSVYHRWVLWWLLVMGDPQQCKTILPSRHPKIL